ncbi:MAG: family 78 glycoside hydrolase catalytic domain, partial [Acidimicrobiales bacterium]
LTGGLTDAVGLDRGAVRFSWVVADRRRSAVQSAYQLVVRRPTAGGDHRRSGRAATVWDSGRVASAAQSLVAYGGPPLATDTAYQWAVRTWDGAGRPGPFSAAATFTTCLGPTDWRADWVTRPADPRLRPDIYTYLRREVTLSSSPIVRATAYVSGDQQYELYVNGVAAGKGQAYSFPDHQYFETLDVTALLRAGRPNALAALTYWDGPTKGHPAGIPGFVLQLSVHHLDGAKEIVTTDGRWRVHAGAWLPGTQRDLEGDLVDFTENIDGPAIPQGWDLPGFDDAGWAAATVLGRAGVAPWRRLVPVDTRIVERPVTARTLRTLPGGAVVADFGKVYAARPTVAFHEGQAGRLVKMRAGYLLDDAAEAAAIGGQAGEVSTLHGTQHTNMRYSYVQRGGHEVFVPFDYLGFRYFQIDDPGEPLAAGDVVARVRHSNLPTADPAVFSSSEPVLGAIFDLARHSALFTAQEQYIDTPTREKGPWLWDGFNESVTAMAVFGERILTAKSLREFAQSQGRFWPNGAVNKIYPTGLGALDINEYTEIYPEWVWQYWLHSGDHRLLADVYPVLHRLAGYVGHAVDRRSGLVTSLPATNVYYSFPVVTRLNVLGVNVFRRVADVGSVVGAPSGEVTALRRQADDLAAAIERHLVRTDGLYADGLEAGGQQVPTASQDTNACAVVYAVAPEARWPAIAGYLAGLGMQAPPRTAAEVVEALAMGGHDRAAVQILTDSSIDGWARILALGGTFTWEVWEPSDVAGDSMSHGWGANVAVPLQRWLLGVRNPTPGFASLEVSPPPSALDWASGTVPTTRGRFGVQWRRPSDAVRSFTLDLDVPANAAATVVLPATGRAGLTESGRAIDRAPGVRVVAVAHRTVTLAVGAGRYRFASSTTP